MKIIGEKLSKKQLLSIKGGGCYHCTCGPNSSGAWLSNSTANSEDWDEYCLGVTGSCEFEENPFCEFIQT